jgi:hypothetical protein
MTERTVTEQQVIDVFNIAVPLDQRIFLNLIFSELFPELPAHNELIKVWNKKVEPEEDEVWRRFRKMSACGNVITYFGAAGHGKQWVHHRRQTPAERGEG